MLVGCPTCTKVGETVALSASGATTELASGTTLTAARIDVRAAAAVLAAGTVVGLLTGLFGVGGGFVIVPALALVLKLPMPEAIGTSLLVIAVNSAVALSSRIATTSIDWGVTFPFMIAAVLGVVSGSRIAHRLDPKRSLRWFAALLVAVAAYTAISAGIALV
jgi:uncharacterized membrane protein YfcA